MCAVGSDATVTCWGENSHRRASAPSGTFTSVSAGFDHSCAVKAEGTIACWGDNEHGQANAPAGTFTAVSTGPDHSCAVKAEGTIACWGTVNYSTPTDFADFIPLGTFASVSVGRTQDCGLRTDGSIVCWAYRNFDVPPVEAPSGAFISMSAGTFHRCGLRASGTIICWGDDGRTEEPEGTFIAVSADAGYSCGLTTDRTAECWIYNEDWNNRSLAGNFSHYGSNGARCKSGWHNGLRVVQECWGDSRYGQVDAPSGTFSALSTGSYYSCGLRTDRSITCWGTDPLGPSDAGPGQFTPTTPRFTAVSGDAAHSCGLTTDGLIICWGSLEELVRYPNAPSGRYIHMDTSNVGTCGVKDDGTVECWGPRSRGPISTTFVELERIHQDVSARLMSVSTGGTIPDPTSGYGGPHTCGIRTDGTVACWGLNDLGQADAPTGTFTSVSAGRDHSCGVRTDGTITCWGQNNDAGLPLALSSADNCGYVGGQYTCFVRTVTVDQTDVPSGTFTSVSAGRNHSCGVRTDGTIACWGLNNFGQAHEPDGTFIAVSVGLGQSCGVRTDGTIICWGLNLYDIAAPSEKFTAVSVPGVGPPNNHFCGLISQRHGLLLG